MAWDEIDSGTRAELLRWFNCTKATAADKRRLAKLHEDKRFWHWDCILCGEPCVHAEPTDEEWVHFQGAADDIDWSFFGDRDTYTEAALMSMCNHCRCYKCVQIPAGSPAWDRVEELRCRPE